MSSSHSHSPDPPHSLLTPSSLEEWFHTAYSGLQTLDRLSSNPSMQALIAEYMSPEKWSSEEFRSGALECLLMVEGVQWVTSHMPAVKEKPKKRQRSRRNIDEATVKKRDNRP